MNNQLTMSSSAYVASLSPRVAHVTHALVVTTTDLANGGPAKASEVCIHDWEALSVGHTGSALAAAKRAGLAMGIRGIWAPTIKALCHRQALEDRSLVDQDRRD